MPWTFENFSSQFHSKAQKSNYSKNILHFFHRAMAVSILHAAQLQLNKWPKSLPQPNSKSKFMPQTLLQIALRKGRKGLHRLAVVGARQVLPTRIWLRTPVCPVQPVPVFTAHWATLCVRVFRVTMEMRVSLKNEQSITLLSTCLYQYFQLWQTNRTNKTLVIISNPPILKER